MLLKRKRELVTTAGLPSRRPKQGQRVACADGAAEYAVIFLTSSLRVRAQPGYRLGPMALQYFHFQQECTWLKRDPSSFEREPAGEPDIPGSNGGKRILREPTRRVQSSRLAVVTPAYWALIALELSTVHRPHRHQRH